MDDNDAAQPTIPMEPPGQVPPEEIDQLFADADLAAAVAQLAISVDRQRRQLILMWVAVLGLAGALTYLTIRGVRGDA